MNQANLFGKQIAATTRLVSKVNSVVSIFVWRIIYLKTDSDNRWKDARSSLKGVIMLSPILGLPWIFGLLARNSCVAIGTIFTVCNAPQGVFLFFMHCLFSKEVRTAMKIHWSKRKARFSIQPQTIVFERRDYAVTYSWVAMDIR
ncbi:adhesion G-protein coupled receptor D1-like [Anneissia japonica]|uniref:adhesion G-protein coupled receptor D1-like n=1 Tax=Anneissia japonica TaxID=1529436 RepID=UPI0014254CE1|nr:adhesion G-protein coupled receptor D1-like [Anneissia japonica]